LRAPTLVVALSLSSYTRSAVQTRLRPTRADVDRKLTPLATISGRACADKQVDVLETGAVM